MRIDDTPDLDVVAVINKLSDKLDAQIVETRQLVANVAKRQEHTEKSLQELKDLLTKSNIESRVDAIEESIQALTAEMKSGDGPPRKKPVFKDGFQLDADMATEGLRFGRQQPRREAHIHIGPRRLSLAAAAVAEAATSFERRLWDFRWRSDRGRWGHMPKLCFT